MKYCAEYVWLDSENKFRSKVMILDDDDNNVNRYDINNYPIWNFDGSSCGFSNVKSSEVYLEPIKIYSNHFHKKEYDVIVYCDTYRMIDGKKKYNTNRHLFNDNNDIKYGLEQEFYLVDKETHNPYNYIKPSFISSFFTSKNSYCNIGDTDIDVRSYLYNVMEMCLDMGILLTGYNLEVGPSQCEFQICNFGINACDDLIMLRYVMVRVSEDFPFYVNYEPKPFSDLPGSGCHINISNSKSRGEGGLSYIYKVIDKMSKDADSHIYNYGKNNKNRLTGYNETSDYRFFTSGVGSRNTSIRIPYDVYNKKYGYFEDRRPGANIDPYIACGYLSTFLV